MKRLDTALDTLLMACKELEEAGIDYRVTGITAVNFYGFGLSTNVMDIAVESDDMVYVAVKVLNLPEESEFNTYDPYAHNFGNGYIRIQGDIMGDPVIHPHGLKLHSKDLLVDRLDIYAELNNDGRIAQAAAFIALTLDDEKIEKYKYVWNRL